MVKQKIIIEPIPADEIILQLESCIEQLENKLHCLEISKNEVLLINIFIINDNQKDFYIIKEEIISIIKLYFKTEIPPFSIIYQPSCNKYKILMEVLYIKKDESVNIENHYFGDIKYKKIIDKYSEELIVAGLMYDNKNNDSIKQYSEYSFKLLEEILLENKMNFSNIIRQWNYIENILLTRNQDNNKYQNYQVFNEIRSNYYKKDIWKYGYPAATGIGITQGGVIIDIIAKKYFDNSTDNFIVPINNPLQIDAYKYNKNVLIGVDSNYQAKENAPKFERAKLVGNKYEGEIYISGTAAIRGQKSIELMNIEEQTLITIENICELVSDDNLNCMLKSRDIAAFFSNKINKNFHYIRVYIKKQEDYLLVKSLCEKYFGNTLITYVISDICRDDLLIEIEAIMYYAQ